MDFCEYRMCHPPISEQQLHAEAKLKYEMSDALWKWPEHNEDVKQSMQSHGQQIDPLLDQGLFMHHLKSFC